MVTDGGERLSGFFFRCSIAGVVYDRQFVRAFEFLK